MVEHPQSAALRGPTFMRLLARLADLEVAQPGPSLPDRLGQWIEWTHAVALSRALDGTPSAPEPDGPGFGDADEAECARMRAALADAIANGRGTTDAVPVDAAQAVADYAPFRQRHVELQRSMLTTTGYLRGHLRDRLARRSPDMARLADVDAVMERVLSPREQALLATVPARLELHFERLRQSAQQAAADAPAQQQVPASTSSGRWLDTFRNDMQAVLLAELDVRFQPIDGLLAALRTH